MSTEDMDQPVGRGDSGNPITGTSPRNLAIIKGFACSCGEENKKKMAELKEWVIDRLYSTHREEWYKPEHLLTSVITELEAMYGASITGVPTDPGGWSAIETETGSNPEYFKEPSVTSWVECDIIEDGFFLTLKLYHERFPNGNVVVVADDDDDEI